MSKQRIDILLVEKDFFPSREQAKKAIMAGIVWGDKKRITKAGDMVNDDVSIEITEKSKYVGRGGEKLEKALETFKVKVKGKICLDIGASTGGFSDCLLQYGAKKVYAVDVGYGQIAWSLRNNPLVEVREKINARYLKKEDFIKRPQLATIDVSFISLDKIIPPLVSVLTKPGEIIALIKPQFEAGRDDVGKGGIVRDPEVHTKCIEKIKVLGHNLKLTVEGVIDSPILGAKGNKEFLIYLIH